MPPTVSVLMAVYNGQDHLRQALDSVLGQTFVDWELVVVDDGSTDATAAILADYAQREPRLRVVKQANAGQTRALNLGLGLARGKYIARLDADDVMCRERLAQQVAYMHAHRDVVLLGTAVELIDEHGQRLCTYVLPTGERRLRRLLIRDNPFAHPSVMMRRGVVQWVGGYNDRFQICQDYDLWIRLARVGRLQNLAKPLTELRIHSQKMTWTRKREESAETLAIRWEAVRRGWYPPLELRHLLKPLVTVCLPGSAICLMLARRRRTLKGTVVCK